MKPKIELTETFELISQPVKYVPYILKVPDKEITNKSSQYKKVFNLFIVTEDEKAEDDTDDYNNNSCDNAEFPQTINNGIARVSIIKKSSLRRSHSFSNPLSTCRNKKKGQ